MEDARERLQQLLMRLCQQNSGAQATSTTCSTDEPAKQYRCTRCQDRQLYDRGDGVYVFCQCRKQRLIERRIKSSLIDPSFTGATFDNYQPAQHTQNMFNTVKNYATNFEMLKNDNNNGLGLMAKIGETEISNIRDPQMRAQMKRQHNSYGLGKTHLLSALGMHLLRQGVQVLMVNDVDIIAELRQAQLSKEESKFEKLLGNIEQAELLIWDDLGKAKTSDWVVSQYYRIINYRYRQRLPICFSSNEDIETLAEKIGDAATSRLIAICRGRLMAVEGPDYRII